MGSRVRRLRQHLHRPTHATPLHHQHQLQHQHLRQDVMINRLIGRAQLEARARTTYQRHGVLLTAAMAVVGTKAWTALSTIGLSTGSRPLLLVVVVVAAPQLLADRHVRDTHMTTPAPPNPCDPTPSPAP